MTKTIQDQDGEVLRMIARAKTTVSSDTSIKPIDTDSTTIEVVVFDGRMISAGSQFGHVAIIIDEVIYTRGHDIYNKKPRSWIKENQTWRDVEGLVLRVSQAEKQKIRNELDRRMLLNEPYDIRFNSCSTNVADVLEMIGILAHDPRYKMDPESTDFVTPKELLIVVSRSKRLIKRNHYLKEQQ
jgi:hypothetical protein